MVNRIAAGEVIIAPVNALKEMIENSMDANATMIDIVVKDGGLKLLQITDNGSGINKEDLPILCERFTTSKLKKFDDLNSIQTYGFRGEALASISYVAKVTVTTKVETEQYGWKVGYADGKMINEPKPIAGRNGTIIVVENLFYNMPSRLRGLRSGTEEFNKILDMVGKYSLHTINIGFSCKKFGDPHFALTIRPILSCQERIRTIFKYVTPNDLMEIKLFPKNEYGVEEIYGQVSNLNFNNKKNIPPIIFINNRLVTCDPLKRSLYQVYSNFLPKPNKPFIYLSMKIKSRNLDVNVHPTKREVGFLYEDEIITKISEDLEQELRKLDISHVFKATPCLQTKNENIEKNSIHSESYLKIKGLSSTIANEKREDHKLVRIDSSQDKITKFIKARKVVISEVLFPNQLSDHEANAQNDSLSLVQQKSNNSYKKIKHNTYTTVHRERNNVNLTSLSKLKQEVDNDAHKELTNIFANMSYIGIVDETRRLASIQYDLKLFIMDYGSICNEFFYQIGLTEFANFGKIYLINEENNTEGLIILEILKQIDGISQHTINQSLNNLWKMKDMMDEYFSVELSQEDGNLDSIKIKTIPLLLKNYIPPLSKLPLFLYRLGTKVDWSHEIDCLRGILKQLALLYIPSIIEHIDMDDQSIDEDTKTQFIEKVEYLKDTLEFVIFPELKKKFLMPKSLSNDIVEMANLPGLYRVFERC